MKVEIKSAVISLDLSEDEQTSQHKINDRLALLEITEVLATEVVQKGPNFIDLIVLGQ